MKQESSKLSELACCRAITRKFKENFDSTERRQFCAEIVADMIEELAKFL